MVQIVKGDLIKLALEGKYEVIAHGCNCFSRMKRGIAPQMAETFGCDKFRMENQIGEGIGKLGQIDFEAKRLDDPSGTPFIRNAVTYFEFEQTEKLLYVVNMYTQYHWSEPDHASGVPLNYSALALCLRKVNHHFKNRKIGLPWVGCGLAGGEKRIVLALISKHIGKDNDVTIVEYDKS